MLAIIENTVFSGVMPCSLVEVFSRFGGTYCLHSHCLLLVYITYASTLRMKAVCSFTRLHDATHPRTLSWMFLLTLYWAQGKECYVPNPKLRYHVRESRPL
jgi:hypothetical protein